MDLQGGSLPYIFVPVQSTTSRLLWFVCILSL